MSSRADDQPKVDALCVDPAYAAQIWPSVRQMILTAMLRGGLSEFTDVERDILRGLSLLWIAWDGHDVIAAAVTRLDIVNGARIGTIVACGGSDLKRFGDLRMKLEQHFRDEGCMSARICGRKGWVRHYPDYKVKSIIMEKAL